MATDAPGTYVLAVELPSSSVIKIGALGTLSFRAGWYAYVGSAMNGLRQRVARHLRSEKRMHWHIDYLLRDARVAEVWHTSGPQGPQECQLAAALAGRFAAIDGFGCSDCRCRSHLFRAPDEATLSRELTARGLTASPPGAWL